MTGQTDGKQELARFLRSRRERLTPDQVGFPAGSRRRTRGLRREEVAILAGLSPTWYTYLEQGRKIQPSPEVLNSIARVLKLTEDERRYMHTLAFGHVVQPGELDNDMSSDDLLRQIVAMTGDLPYPVYAANVYCDLIAWNHAATQWYGDWGALPSGECNLLRWMLTHPAARERLADWELDARDLVARWRVEIGRSPDDRRMPELVDEFRSLSPEFAIWWDDHEVLEHRTAIRHFDHPHLGRQSLRIVPMLSPHLSASGVAFHLPV